MGFRKKLSLSSSFGNASGARPIQSLAGTEIAALTPPTSTNSPSISSNAAKTRGRCNRRVRKRISGESKR